MWYLGNWFYYEYFSSFIHYIIFTIPVRDFCILSSVLRNFIQHSSIYKLIYLLNILRTSINWPLIYFLFQWRRGMSRLARIGAAAARFPRTWPRPATAMAPHVAIFLILCLVHCDTKTVLQDKLGKSIFFHTMRHLLFSEYLRPLDVPYARSTQDLHPAGRERRQTVYDGLNSVTEAVKLK